MIWRILAVGRPSLTYARDGVNEYLKRLEGFGRVEVQFFKSSSDTYRRMIEQSSDCFRLMLDERGKQFASRGFAAEIQKWENRSISRCALLVGGSDGWDEETRKSAGLLWSLGSLTLQHELALVVALEQIYRAATIRAGMPYHRD